MDILNFLSIFLSSGFGFLKMLYGLSTRCISHNHIQKYLASGLKKLWQQQHQRLEGDNCGFRHWGQEFGSLIQSMFYVFVCVNAEEIIFSFISFLRPFMLFFLRFKKSKKKIFCVTIVLERLSDSTVVKETWQDYSIVFSSLNLEVLWK